MPRVLQATLLLLAFSFLAAVTAGPAAASTCASDHPIYGLKTFGSVRCGSALVVAARLDVRYDQPRDFRGSRSHSRITQSDARGHRYTCKWQSGDTHHEIILWACTLSRGNTVTWIWRANRL